MIKYNLKCQNHHEFESWFSDSKEFDKLKNKKLLQCIFCNSKEITKSIMSPMVSISRNKIQDELQMGDKDFQNKKKKLLKLRSYIEKNFEFVGTDFSKKVREIYYDKNNKKMIYGITSPEEREELKEEGIDLLSIPWVDKDN